MTVLAYASSLSGTHVYEDDVWPTWHGWRGALAQAVRWPGRLLPPLTMDLTTAVAGPGSTPARIVNLGWHLLNGLLVGLLAWPLLSATGAVFAMALFWLHPLQTETVAYVASRPELIAATCLLLALLAVQRGWIGVAWVCAVATLLAKELTITAVLLVPLFAWWTGQRWSCVAITAWAASLVMLAIGGLLALHQRGLDGPLYGLPSIRYTAGQLAALGRLVLLWPEALVHPQALTIDHDWRWITRPVLGPVLALWVWALLAAHRHHWPWWGFAVAWTLVALSLRLVLPIPDGLHEHHLYTASIIWSLASGAYLFQKASA